MTYTYELLKQRLATFPFGTTLSILFGAGYDRLNCAERNYYWNLFLDDKDILTGYAPSNVFLQLAASRVEQDELLYPQFKSVYCIKTKQNITRKQLFLELYTHFLRTPSWVHVNSIHRENLSCSNYSPRMLKEIYPLLLKLGLVENHPGYTPDRGKKIFRSVVHHTENTLTPSEAVVEWDNLHVSEQILTAISCYGRGNIYEWDISKEELYSRFKKWGLLKSSKIPLVETCIEQLIDKGKIVRFRSGGSIKMPYHK